MYIFAVVMCTLPPKSAPTHQLIQRTPFSISLSILKERKTDLQMSPAAVRDPFRAGCRCRELPPPPAAAAAACPQSPCCGPLSRTWWPQLGGRGGAELRTSDGTARTSTRTRARPATTGDRRRPTADGDCRIGGDGGDRAADGDRVTATRPSSLRRGRQRRDSRRW